MRIEIKRWALTTRLETQAHLFQFRLQTVFNLSQSNAVTLHP
jgi:hypothetical protein